MCPVPDWTRVRILTGPVITDHWTEAPPFFFLLKSLLIQSYLISFLKFMISKYNLYFTKKL